MTRSREEWFDGLFRDSLNALLRRVMVIALVLGVPTIIFLFIALAPDDPVVAWTYPPLLAFLLTYAWVLLRRPEHTVRFSRIALIMCETVWVAMLYYRLVTGPDITAAWHGLFPTWLLSHVIFLLVGFLVFTNRQALVNAAGVMVAVVGAGLAGLLPRGGEEHVLDLLRFGLYLTFIALLLQVLSRAKARLAVAVSAAHQATIEAHQMRDMAYLDPLTGVANRRRLIEELTFQADRAAPDHPVAVVYFDLDRFKSINDTFGHAVGDDVLCRVAQVASRVVRQDDVVGRLGGEEFVIVAPGTGHDRALQLAERLRSVLPQEVGEPLGVQVTASFGVVTLRPGESATAVLTRVDGLMYEAKSGGRDRVAGAL